ncbi:hypothetical protein BCIN_12g05580 [Botrytis cinerea B05.10]|uniref:Uncharacterized protein n=1 Tax=Botryotinia fuckeliana (strain B05.10) TaxID=332648 RepID=A0A384JZJ4_BOTFB|nr:hypothetical protein BCIN_12g05580 [Botrytis cinerea B05.10]ATZ56019.1 hypothetical protein BCIN_12g05580 [Botrytis cinerea B05.10]
MIIPSNNILDPFFVINISFPYKFHPHLEQIQFYNTMDKSQISNYALPNIQPSESEKPPTPITCRQDSTSTIHKGLITYDDLPSWHQDNPSIFTSYRPITHSLRDSLKTFFTLHNETFNIHTHSIPFLICLLLTGLIFYIFSIYFPKSPLVDRFIFSIFFWTTMICMGFSMAYHTLMNHSKHVAEVWLKLDFLGIVVATLGDFVTAIYVAFYCEWKLQVGYWVMVLVFILIFPVPLLYLFPFPPFSYPLPPSTLHLSSHLHPSSSSFLFSSSPLFFLFPLPLSTSTLLHLHSSSPFLPSHLHLCLLLFHSPPSLLLYSPPPLLSSLSITTSNLHMVLINGQNTHILLDNNSHFNNPHRSTTSKISRSSLAYFSSMYFYRNRMFGFCTYYSCHCLFWLGLCC